MSQGDMKNTLISLTVMMLREERQLNGFLAGLARREDASRLRAVVLNMVMVSRLSHARRCQTTAQLA